MNDSVLHRRKEDLVVAIVVTATSEFEVVRSRQTCGYREFSSRIARPARPILILLYTG